MMSKKPMKPMKLMTQRSTIGEKGDRMKKKGTIGFFEPEMGDVDEVDFQTIIQSKMIDKTNMKKNRSETKMETQMKEEISPSWFNFENQRFDAS